jgi:hypothetical protein
VCLIFSQALCTAVILCKTDIISKGGYEEKTEMATGWITCILTLEKIGRLVLSSMIALAYIVEQATATSPNFPKPIYPRPRQKYGTGIEAQRTMATQNKLRLASGCDVEAQANPVYHELTKCSDREGAHLLPVAQWCYKIVFNTPTVPRDTGRAAESIAIALYPSFLKVQALLTLRRLPYEPTESTPLPPWVISNPPASLQELSRPLQFIALGYTWAGLRFPGPDEVLAMTRLQLGP